MLIRHAIIPALVLLGIVFASEAKEPVVQSASAAALTSQEYIEMMGMLRGHEFSALDRLINGLQR